VLVALVDLREDHAGNMAELVLQGDEDGVALAGTLAHQHEAGGLGEAAAGPRADVNRRLPLRPDSRFNTMRFFSF